MTSTGDTPVHIITFVWWEYDAWMNCEPIGMVSEDLYELDSMGGIVEGVLPGPGSLIVAFDHPNSCDEEDSSIPDAEISFKVSHVT